MPILLGKGIIQNLNTVKVSLLSETGFNSPHGPVFTRFLDLQLSLRKLLAKKFSYS